MYHFVITVMTELFLFNVHTLKSKRKQNNTDSHTVGSHEAVQQNTTAWAVRTETSPEVQMMARLLTTIIFSLVSHDSTGPGRIFTQGIQQDVPSRSNWQKLRWVHLSVRSLPQQLLRELPLISNFRWASSPSLRVLRAERQQEGKQCWAGAPQIPPRFGQNRWEAAGWEN